MDTKGSWVTLLYCDNVNGLSKKQYADLLAFVSEQRKNKILKYLKLEDRILGLTSFALLNYGLHMKGLLSLDFSYSTNQYGKPYVRGSMFEFNISHTNNAIACAIANTTVGVDIQEKIYEYQNVMEYVCSSSEIEHISASISPVECFTKLWTLKESYVKCIGTGIWDGLEHLDFSLMSNDCGNMYGYYFHYIIEKEYCLSVCSTEKKIEIRKISLGELLRYVLISSNN